ncbi:MAG: hypothetical protein ACOCXA_02215 [Planctomycetota bacterium]
MIDWQDKISRTRLTDARTGERIPAGSLLYSALVFRGDHFERLDYQEHSWPEVDQSSLVSWWRHQLPPPQQADQSSRLDANQLLQIFQDLASSRVRPQQCLAYCLALLLMRLKKLRFIGLEHREDQSWMLYENRVDRQHYRLRDPTVDEAEVDRVQAELLELIGY